MSTNGQPDYVAFRPAARPAFWGDAIACDPGAIIALALFALNIAVWAAILG